MRFKALVVGEPRAVQSVSLYTDGMAVAQAPVPIHELVLQPPSAPHTVLPGLTAGIT